MTIETATYISDLNSTLPAAGDLKSEGDDHIRLVKSTVKTTFPNVTGAVTPTHTVINNIAAGTFPSVALSGITAGTYTGIHSYTVANTTVIQVYSGAAASYAAVGVGRTAVDLTLGAVGAANNFFNSSAQGDAVIQSVSRMLLGTGANYTIALNTDRSVFIANDASTPGTPSGGGVLYVESGVLKYKGSSGTVTTLGVA